MISIVLGTFFGDEGKGQTVHNLCNKYIGKRESVLVVRFSGGHQVGHTVKHGDMMHTFSNFGSGTLLGVLVRILYCRPNYLYVRGCRLS